MDLGTLQAFQRELCCSICRNYLIDPVTVDCGHSFCRPCLCLLWEEGQAPTGCPVCGKIPQRTDFHTNIALKRLASLARQSRPHNINSSEKQICVLHEEEKGLFCEVEQRLLCGPCSESPEHEAHGHSPIGQAAEECREKLLKKMDPLWRSTQEMQNNLNQEISKIHSLMDYAAFRKGMIKYQYQKMRQFLLEEEQLHLGTLDREAEEIVRQLQDSEDLENILEWTELVQMEKPQPVKPELTSRPITGVLDMLNKFRVDDPLSKERASHYMNLSEDVRNVIFGDDHDGAPRESQRAENFAAWGAQAFSSGKHYWEVDVTHSSNWILGVCKDSRTANTNAFEEAFFLFSSKRNNLYSLSNIFAPLTHYVQRPLGQVGVFLDYDNTVVSFYDVSKGSLIYSFFPSSLSSLLTPFFCIEKTGTKDRGGGKGYSQIEGSQQHRRQDAQKKATQKTSKLLEKFAPCASLETRASGDSSTSMVLQSCCLQIQVPYYKSFGIRFHLDRKGGQKIKNFTRFGQSKLGWHGRD
ncbi:tripartite motif-containing protein 64-like [Macaca mulatta]